MTNFRSWIMLPALFWGMPILEAVHNLEEGLGMAEFARLHRASLSLSEVEGWVATQAVSVVAALLTFVLLKGRRSTGLYWLIVIQAVILVNVFSHLIVSVATHALSPGTYTAVLLNLPFSILLFRQALRAGLVTRRTLSIAMIWGLLLHMPLVLLFLGIGKLIA